MVPFLQGFLTKLAAFDISSNYFEGKIPGGLTPSAVTSQRNCLQGVMRQRSNGDCEAFYKSMGLHFLGLGQIASPPESPFDEPGKDNNHLAAILGGVFGGLGLVLIVILCTKRSVHRMTLYSPLIGLHG